MTDTISSVTAVPSSIANDGTEVSVVSAVVLTDDKPAAAGVMVNWTTVGGEASDAGCSCRNRRMVVVRRSRQLLECAQAR